MMPFPGELRAKAGDPGTFTLQVEENHPAFDGHFPNEPILSGLIQVDWAIRLGREVFTCPGTFQGLEHLKFQAPIRPEEPLELDLSWDGEAGHLAFRYSGREGRKSQGIAVFRPAP
ncbi:MAG: hypothetical protein U0P46_14105 [Holophagaceae bacterium]